MRTASRHPPITPIAGAAVTHRLTDLVASDTNRFAAFVADPDTPPRAAVVIFPDVRGLFGFYEELALRFRGARHRRHRDRLLRSYRRREPTRRTLPVHGACREDHTRAAPG